MHRVAEEIKELLDGTKSGAKFCFSPLWGADMALPEGVTALTSAHQEDATRLSIGLAKLLDKEIPPEREPDLSQKGALLSHLAATAEDRAATKLPSVLHRACSNAVDCVLDVAGKHGRNILRRSVARKELKEGLGTSNYVAQAEACVLGELAARLCRAYNGELEGVDLVGKGMEALYNNCVAERDEKETNDAFCEMLTRLAWHPAISGYLELPTPIFTAYSPGSRPLLVPLTRLHDMIIELLGEHSRPRFWAYLPHYLTALRTLAEMANMPCALVVPAYVQGATTRISVVGYRQTSGLTDRTVTMGGISTHGTHEDVDTTNVCVSLLAMRLRQWTNTPTVGRQAQVKLAPHVWWTLAGASRMSAAEVHDHARRLLEHPL